MIRVLGESKSRLVKAVGAESCGESRNQKLHTAVVTKIFFYFICCKIAQHCGAKRIFKSKCTKHVRFGPLFEHCQIPVWCQCLHNGQ